ncbi:hypothetical protein CANINC_003109 [Pichia inconspicua]|uniref:FAD-binding FR-type domain-containing protein n=1 Tax=Pichia inconspicua TaxID=52247 RepID=A0A4T0X162_9ASCO|nr:hypothetical protein CANINC_003109 [[Candida] inconspicua]
MLTTLILLFGILQSASSYEFESTELYSGTGGAEMWTCNQGIQKLTFDFVSQTPKKIYYDKFCAYPPATGSLLLCAQYLLEGQDETFMKKIIEKTVDTCRRYSSYHYDEDYFWNQLHNATSNHVAFDDIKNHTAPLYVNMMPNKTLVDPIYIGYTNYYRNIDSGTWFSVGFCAFFLLLLLLGAIHNFMRLIFLKGFNNLKIVKQFQSKVLFSTLLPGGKFSDIYEWKFLSILIPNMVQFLVDVMIFIIQMVFYCKDYKQNEGYFFGTSTYVWQRAVADRTGIMSFGKIPLLILFAGRNNFLLWVTGWSYSTFLHFHKIVAYWMALDALIHSVAWTCIESGRYVRNLKQTYFACGVAATVICFVMIGATLYPLRRFYYEYFLTLHIIFAIAFIIMCWYHCNILGWMEWLVAACAVWFFDRLVRVIRCAAFGWRTATVTVVGDEMFKVEVPKPIWWFHKPGTYCYVYFAGWIFWENHPFTTVLEDNNICAYIKVKKGVTYRIWNKLNANGGSMQWKVNFEGPYGGEMAPAIRKYNDVLLIAGGSGVPGILEHAAQAKTGKLVWVAQHLSQIHVYGSLLLKLSIDVEIFVTRDHGEAKSCTIHDLLSDSESSSEDDKKVAEMQGQVTVHFERPNMFEVIDSYITDNQGDNVAIVACGPPRMMDDLRHVISAKVTSWKKSVDFFDEFQIW